MNWHLPIQYLPSVIVSLTSLVVMLFAAVQREHRYTSLLTSLGLFAALLVQVSLGKEEVMQTLLFRFDGLAHGISVLLLLVVWLLSLLLYRWMQIIDDQKEEYYLLVLMATQGALVLTASIHFASFFIGLELMGLSLVAMVAYPGRQSVALEAGIKYLILSAVASAFLLMAMALIYLYLGSLSMTDLSQQLSARLADSAASPQHWLLMVAVVLFLLAIAFKLSLVPCHLWVADVFEGAPLPTSALLASLSKASVFVVLMRLYSYGDWSNIPQAMSLVAVLSGLSILVGNLLALQQRSILRLLAYSSIAHFGYILLALLAYKSGDTMAVTESLATEAMMFYLAAYLLTVIGSFGVLMLLPGVRRIDDLLGLFWSHRGLSMVLALLFMSLAGIPLTLGFVGKFYLAMTAVNAQLWWLLACLVVGSVLGLFYYLRIILIMVDRPENSSVESFSKTGQSPGHELGEQFVLVVVVFLVLGAGVFPGWLADWVRVLSGAS